MLVAATAVAGVVVAACGSSSSGGGAGAAASPSATSSSAVASGGVARVATHDGPLGAYLTDAVGRTLYEFAADTGGISTCTGQCATFWPPLPGTVEAICDPARSWPRKDTAAADGFALEVAAGLGVEVVELDVLLHAVVTSARPSIVVRIAAKCRGTMLLPEAMRGQPPSAPRQRAKTSGGPPHGLTLIQVPGQGQVQPGRSWAAHRSRSGPGRPAALHYGPGPSSTPDGNGSLAPVADRKLTAPRTSK